MKKPDPYHKGRPGTRWALMEKFVIARVPNGPPYLIRWRLVHTPFFGILLHKIDGPDPDAHPHDHPWSFISVVLKGGYTERTTYPGAVVPKYLTHRPGSFHRMRRGMYHSIAQLHDGSAWTLVLTGPRRSDWGFLVGRTHVPWRVYLGLED